MNYSRHRKQHKCKFCVRGIFIMRLKNNKYRDILNVRTDFRNSGVYQYSLLMWDLIYGLRQFTCMLYACLPH